MQKSIKNRNNGNKLQKIYKNILTKISKRSINFKRDQNIKNSRKNIEKHKKLVPKLNKI